MALLELGWKSGNMKSKYIYLIITIILIIPVSCDLDSGSEGTIDYYSKEVTFSKYVDPDQYDLEPVETRVYDENGTLSAVYRYTYEDYDGVYLNTRTDVYSVTEGEETLVEFYIYSFVKDYYIYDGETVYDYLLSGAETREPSAASDDGELGLYYTVAYTDINSEGTDLDTVNYSNYTEIIDYKVTGSGDEIIARQEVTYLEDDYDYMYYRTEKYFAAEDPDNDDYDLFLTEEYACWYDDDSWDYMYELYHSSYSPYVEADDQFYYLTRYQRDEDGNVYEQADYLYDLLSDGESVDSVPQISSAAYDNLSFDDLNTGDTDPFTYKIDIDEIGSKYTVLNIEYDSLGNVTKDTRSLYGSVTEYTSYSYDDDSNLLEECRYTEGGTLLYDRTSIRYTEEYINDVYYEIETKYVYKYYDYEVDEEAGSRMLKGISAGINSPEEDIKLADIKNNHRFK